MAAISALVLSPRERRVSLYLQFLTGSVTGETIREFLRGLLRHLRGRVLLLWDRGAVHRDRRVRQLVAARPRLEPEFFPAYAPECNPTEYVWNHLDSVLANGAPADERELAITLGQVGNELGGSQRLLRACFKATGLPWLSSKKAA